MRPLTCKILPGAAGILIGCAGGGMDPTRPTPPIASGQAVTATATISFVNVEGGCRAIVTDGGARYEPINLAMAFRTDGARVRVVLRDAPDMSSLCMVGPLVVVDSISAQ